MRRWKRVANVYVARARGAAHRRFTDQTGITAYFADPHSPWQRGANGNTNGLLRDYFPKSTDLSVYPPQHLALVAEQMNNRPRKRRGWSTLPGFEFQKQTKMGPAFADPIFRRPPGTRTQNQRIKSPMLCH